MNKAITNFVCGSAIFLLSGTASATFSASASLEFLDCSCEVRGRHTLIVEFASPFDSATNVSIRTVECGIPGFCFPMGGGRVIPRLDGLNTILTGGRWGVIQFQSTLMEYEVGKSYCAKTFDLGLFPQFRYFLNDDFGSTNMDSVPIDVYECGMAPSGGLGNCSVNTP